MISADNLVSPIFRQSVISGNNKNLYKGSEKGIFILSFLDNSEKISHIRNRISAVIWDLLTHIGVNNHFLRISGPREQIVSSLEMLPFFLEVHNITNQEFSDRIGCSAGIKLPKGLVEIRFKAPEKGDPIISREHISSFGLLKDGEWDELSSATIRVNDILQGFFKALGITLVSMRLDFGRLYRNGEKISMCLGDEMSPKNLSLSIDDMLDLDSDILYFEVAKRFGILRDE